MLEKSKSFREKNYTLKETVVNNNEERVDFLIAKPAAAAASF